MAHPYYHSLSSAKKFGGTWEDYIALHAFMDSTKAHVADARHRLLLHNAFGIFVVQLIVGTTFVRRSDGKRMATRVILERHVEEDFGGRIPTIGECFAQLPADPLREDKDVTLLHCMQSAEKYGGEASDYEPIHEFLNWPRDFLPDSRFQRIFHNGWGIHMVYKKMGEYLTRASDGKTVLVRQIAQDHIICDLGYVPTIEESLKGIHVQSWMYNKAQRLSRTLLGEEENTPASSLAPLLLEGPSEEELMQQVVGLLAEEATHA